MSLDFTITKEVTIEVDIDVVNFIPHRPAPSCQDHDSPRFSDSGDDAEFSYDECFIRDGDKRVMLPRNIADIILEILKPDGLDEEIIRIGEEKASEYDARDERDFDDERVR